MAAMGNLLKDIRKGREDRSLYLRGILPYLFALGCARAWVTLAVAAPALALPAAFDLHDVFDARSVGGVDDGGGALPHRRRHGPGRRARGHCPCGRGRGGGRCGLRPLPASLGRGLKLHLAHPHFPVHDGLPAGGRRLRVLLRRPGRFARGLRFGDPAAGGAALPLYSFAYGLRQHQLAAGAGMHSSVSTAIVMAVLFASAYFFSNRFNIGTLYRSPLVLIVCGFLLVPVEGVFGTAASSYLISMSYSLVGIIVALLLYDISKRLGVTVVIFAAIKGAEQVFVIWGKGVAEAMAAAGMNAGAQDAVIAVAVVAMMLAATLILLSEKELASRWGVRILDAGGLVEKTPEELRRDERAAELAEHARLTPRETEILALVAQGKNGPAIMQELFIAEGTFKAHMSHIYEKCGVANRRELVALLGAR